MPAINLPSLSEEDGRVAGTVGEMAASGQMVYYAEPFFRAKRVILPSIMHQPRQKNWGECTPGLLD